MSADKKVPDIRFKGFSGEWAQESVFNIAPLQRGFDLPKNLVKAGTYPVVMSNGINGFHNSFKAKAPGVVTGRSGTIGNIHYIDIDYWPHNTSLWVTNFHNNVPLFIYYLYVKLNLSRFSTGSGVPTLNRNDIHIQSVALPKNSKEQTAIGNYLQRLDSLINQHQQKHDKLSNIKKAMLEKMFPKQGETVPEIRFKGFSGEWEEKQLSEIGCFSSGVGFSENEQSGLLGIPFFKVSDMNLIGNDCYMTNANNYVTEEQISRLNYIPINENSILFAKVGAAIFLERKRIAKDFLIDNNMMAFSPNQDIIFMKQWFDSISLSKHTQVGALPSLKASDLKKIKLKIPKIEEQTAIGNYFQKLDELINQYQQQITKLNHIKQACLSKMFI
ncbi:restriction endonuclease subunit S [Proteus penneri]|uniref:restriction endonuclease subunit S n=1 Tax=Proteus penneri TaxID=102862 RepID=UPI00288BB0A4|nr:restriction endonuclease subunit S [Proteus penneri]